MISKSDQSAIKSYLEDSSNLSGGYADKVVIPESTEELSSVLAEANAKRTPVTVSGGGTATTGSRIPFGGIIISMERLNRILSIDADTRSCRVQAGVTVDSLQEECLRKGLFYTSHPTEKNAFLGGTISTNASGARSYRYGPTRRCVNGLRMSLATGEVLSLEKGRVFLARGKSSFEVSGGRRIDVPMPTYRMPDVKSSAGYYAKDGMDLVDLFIGQEGTLSVITEAELKLEVKPAEIGSCFAFFGAEERAWEFADGLRQKKEWGILSIEYFSNNALDLLREKNKSVPSSAHGAIFFEEDVGVGARYDAADRWLELIEDCGGSMDGTWVAMNEKEAQGFASLRYAIPEAVNEIVRHTGMRKFSTDIAVPVDRMGEMLRFHKKVFERESVRNIIFGHIGESHVHANALPATPAEADRAKDICLELIKKGIALGGTVSAEHGIGKIKHEYLRLMYGDRGVMEMVAIKKAIDPACILGPGNIFPKELLQ